MVEEHRRVEPRQIVGTGMATDPERIERIAVDAERHARAWREAPEAGFGDVLGRASARGELADEPPPPDRRTTTPPEPAGSANTKEAVTSPPKAAAAPTAKPLRASLRAPDPRQRALQLEMDRAVAAASRKES